MITFIFVTMFFFIYNVNYNHVFYNLIQNTKKTTLYFDNITDCQKVKKHSKLFQKLSQIANE